MGKQYGFGGLELAREWYCGNDSDNYYTHIYSEWLYGHDVKGRKINYLLRIDDDTMDEVIRRMPVAASHLKENMDGTIVKEPPVFFSSWIDGCKMIYK